jgi:hypothetical protein
VLQKILPSAVQIVVEQREGRRIKERVRRGHRLAPNR